MPSEIIIGFLSLVGTIIGTFGGIMIANKLSNYRISQLEKKVEKHNQVIDRTYNLEKKAALMEQGQSEMKNDISDIKTDVKELKEKTA
jgi:gas vesicle protein